MGRLNMVKIVEKSVDEVLKLCDENKAKSKQYRLNGIDLQVVAQIKNIWYAGEACLDNIVYDIVYEYGDHGEKLKGIDIDKDGHPFVWYGVTFQGYKIKPEIYPHYEELFLHNTCFAASMGHCHQYYISAAEKVIKKDKKHHWLLKKYKPLEEKLNHIEKKVRTSDVIGRYTDQYIPLTSEEKTLKAKYIDNWVSDFWDLWYVSWLKKTGYERKIKNASEPGQEERAISRLIKKAKRQLDKAGFKKVDKFSFGEN